MPSNTYRAVVGSAVGAAEVRELPAPAVREGYVLVRTRAVALNPTDWKTLLAPGGRAVGSKLGCDFAGVVEAVGAGVTKVAVGDRVCGMALGGQDTEHGAFGEFVLTPVDPVMFKIPDSLSFEDASTLGVGLTTVGQGLYQCLKLPLPSHPLPAPVSILINGGSTTTGILGIQFAKLSGLRVLATASPHNFAYLRSLGADALYDYHHPDAEALGAQIRAEAGGGGPTLAWDCIHTESSARLCALALSVEPARPARLATLGRPEGQLVRGLNPNVGDVELTLGYSVFNQPLEVFGEVWSASREDWEFGKMFWEEVGSRALAEGRVQVARWEADRGGKGLEGVLVGLDELKKGRVSAVKLVYTL